MSSTDWLVVLAYFVLLVGIVRWSSRRQQNATDYFLAGREAGWFVVGLGRNGAEYSVLIIACLLANAWAHRRHPRLSKGAEP